MMDELDEDEDLKGGETAPRYAVSHWRPQIVRRVLERAKLLTAWLWLTVWPLYGWRSIVSMALITCGRLADAASFVVGMHILTRSLTHGGFPSDDLQSSLTWAVAGIAGILLIASTLSYIGSKLAVQIVLAYEKTSLVEGLAIAHQCRLNKTKITKQERASITRQAPRMMARNLLHVINGGTSGVMMISGALTCLVLFPALTGLLMLSLVMLSPLYILAALHGTNIGHSIRSSSSAYSEMIKQLESKWLKSSMFDRREAQTEIESDLGYNDFINMYGARLKLSARNHLLSNLTLAFVLSLSSIWFINEIELTAKSVTVVVSYIIALRLFAHGLAGVFHALQSINTTLPFCLAFLMRDPRFKKVQHKQHHTMPKPLDETS
ncbi:hypothetical protein [Microvirga sp. M2]|uniref:hypothetical protein n=1 Tax=Microvirga sp. M2 TaxID=3073270 RepID=UPI0039C011F9